jgi:hypothetical protein
MGIYAQYLEQKMDFNDLTAERKKQLHLISTHRNNNDVFVYAADLTQGDPKIGILYEDIVSIKDQIENLSGKALDVILETPGGMGEVAEDIVKIFRYKYTRVSFIIPGRAMSAGTIMTMSGDEILMEPSSALGPIDAQLQWRDQVISADAFLEGFDKIKKEAAVSNSLNRAYIPILSNISPGQIEHAQNAQHFAHNLVADWLVNYKFKNWLLHSSDNRPVTADERKERALQIAEALSDQKRWYTHGRSIKIKDLESLRLKITDYSLNPPLYDAITKYFTLLRMSFDATNIYKIFETPTSQIYRFKLPPGTRQATIPQHKANYCLLNIECPKCKHAIEIQANFTPDIPVEPTAIPFPTNNKLNCPNCNAEINIQDIRLRLESESKRRIL